MTYLLKISYTILFFTLKELRHESCKKLSHEKAIPQKMFLKKIFCFVFCISEKGLERDIQFLRWGQISLKKQMTGQRTKCKTETKNIENTHYYSPNITDGVETQA